MIPIPSASERAKMFREDYASEECSPPAIEVIRDGEIVGVVVFDGRFDAPDRAHLARTLEVLPVMVGADQINLMLDTRVHVSGGPPKDAMLVITAKRDGTQSAEALFYETGKCCESDNCGILEIAWDNPTSTDSVKNIHSYFGDALSTGFANEPFDPSFYLREMGLSDDPEKGKVYVNIFGFGVIREFCPSDLSIYLVRYGDERDQWAAEAAQVVSALTAAPWANPYAPTPPPFSVN